MSQGQYEAQPNITSLPKGALLYDCIPPTERSEYALWRGAALEPLFRNAMLGKFVLNVGPLDAADSKIHFSESWESVQGHARSKTYPDSAYQGADEAREYLAGQHIFFSGPVALVYALRTDIDPRQHFNFKGSHGIYWTRDLLPITTLDRHTFKWLSKVLSAYDIVPPNDYDDPHWAKPAVP